MRCITTFRSTTDRLYDGDPKILYYIILYYIILYYIILYYIILYYIILYYDRLCGLVVRVSGYRYRGLGFDSRRYQIF